MEPRGCVQGVMGSSASRDGIRRGGRTMVKRRDVRSRQVGISEMSASEPFEEASKRSRRYQNQRLYPTLGLAWQGPTYGPGGVRRKEGMTHIRALVRNLRTGPGKRLKWKPHEAESTEAPTRGGRLRRSEETGPCPWSKGSRSPASSRSQRTTEGAPRLGGSR